MKLVKKFGIFALSILFVIASGLFINSISFNSVNANQSTINSEEDALDLAEMPYNYKENLCFYNNISINKGFSFGDNKVPLRLKTSSGYVEYEKGFCIQANTDNTGENPTKVGWDINGIGATRFTATVGLNQRVGAENDGGSVQFQVRVRLNDGPDTIIYTSNVLSRNDNAVNVDVEIPSDATYLVLAVLNGGDGEAFDNGSWCNPKLYCNFINLSDMTASSTNMGYGDLLYNDVIEGDSTLYNIVTEPVNETENRTYMEHTKFYTNLFTHATSTVDFSIANMGVTRFVCYAGITSTKIGSNGIRFTVHADGEELFSQVTYQDSQMMMIDVRIPANKTTITLGAVSPDGDVNSDHAIWCAPTFFGNNVNGYRGISLTAGNDNLNLEESESTDFKLYACTFKNDTVEINDFTITSGNSSVAMVDGHKVTAVGVGQTAISVSVTLNGVTFSTYTNVTVGSKNSETHKQLNLASPDGNSKIVITLRDGWIDYSLTKNGKLYVEKSRMGVETSMGNMWEGFTSATLSDVRIIDETYEMYSGKFTEHRNYCKEQDITFTHSSGAKLKVIARAYNDGAAFRYVVSSADGGAFTMINENTSIVIPFFSYTWSSPMPENGTPEGKQFTHEQTATSGMIGNFSKYKVIPYMYKTPDDIYCLVSESDLDGSYWGSVLSSEYEKIVRLTKSKQQTSNLNVSSGTLTMPWRAFMAGDLEEIVKSNMIEDLAPECKIDDTSWIDPGITSWSWMAGLNGYKGDDWYAPTGGCGYQGNPEAIKNYIDLAAEMGWEYFILDEGWQPWVKINTVTSGNIDLPNNLWDDTEPLGSYQNFPHWYHGVYDWMTTKSEYYGVSTLTYTNGTYTGEKIIDYANRKGVKLIAWLHTSTCDTPTRMDKVFSMLHDIGIAGIKIDFFDSESQWTMDLYRQLYEKTAEYELLGIFHGSNKPTGERRTYPHVLNREAIPGEELNSTRISQQSIYAYLRGTIGPTDLTPYIYTVGSGDTNMASQMAFSIIYESGMTCFASTADEYRALSDEVKYYYKNFPSNWEDLKLLSGEVGEKMSIARKTTDNKWYIGCISTKAGTDNILLDFLDSGKSYYAHIYTDVANDRRAVNYQKQTVTSASSLVLTNDKNGGYAVILEEIPHTHAPSSTWSTSPTQHWHACECEEKLNLANHNFVEETTPSAENLATSATCQALATYYKVCADCGYKGTDTYFYGELANHNFTGDAVICSEQGHKHKCVSVGCQELGALEQHEFGNDNVCDECNYEKIVTSSSSETSSSQSSTENISSSSATVSSKGETAKKGGCGGNISSLIVLLPLLPLSMLLLSKKKRKE